MRIKTNRCFHSKPSCSRNRCFHKQQFIIEFNVKRETTPSKQVTRPKRWPAYREVVVSTPTSHPPSPYYSRRFLFSYLASLDFTRPKREVAWKVGSEKRTEWKRTDARRWCSLPEDFASSDVRRQPNASDFLTFAVVDETEKKSARRRRRIPRLRRRARAPENRCSAVFAPRHPLRGPLPAFQPFKKRPRRFPDTVTFEHVGRGERHEVYFFLAQTSRNAFRAMIFVRGRFCEKYNTRTINAGTNSKDDGWCVQAQTASETKCVIGCSALYTLHCRFSCGL